jgi:hypothetical protein
VEQFEAVEQSSWYQEQWVGGAFILYQELWQAAHSSWHQELCPVHRGLIAMSGSS